MKRFPPALAAQRGVALAVALILLVVMTLMVLSGVRMSSNELRMSMNDEIRVNAFEQAQSLVDTVIRDFSNTPVLADGEVLCLNESDAMCDDDDLKLPAGTHYDEDDDTINVMITRIPPQSAPPPVGSGFSADKFASAQHQVIGKYDRNATGQGGARVREGLAIVYSAPSEIPTFTDAGS
jgi:hypothetical protein